MSDELHGTHPDAHAGGAHPPAEEDRIRSGMIVFIGVAAVVLFFVASLAVIGAMRRQQRAILPQGPAPYAEPLGTSKIGLLEQRLFENSNQVQAMYEAQRQKLRSYGWVDPAQGVVRIPIDRAMEMVMRGERAPASSGHADAEKEQTGVDAAKAKGGTR
jgi:hypothetical protein